ncbi:restriction endonuclease subunit S [Clostridioides sp. ES-S-0001-03]|nr:restriction endonuclease subunit S [Clostridioides sp. ES-S-0001-03]MCC0762519.1 restriction endonuclease subunit S [Clostridioides sp. ES-S-0006-03]
MDMSKRLPQGWKKVKLGTLVNIKTGRLDANESSLDGEYPFFTCSVKPLKISSYSYDCECVLVAGNGDLNVKYYDGKFDAYQRTYIIESIDKNKLEVKYLYYFMSKYIDVLRAKSVGGVIKYIKLGDLTDAKIPVPPLEEQERIVSILERAEGAICKREESNRLLDELVKSRFIDMFGDPVTNLNNWDIETIGSVVKSITAGWSANGEARVKMKDEKAVLKVSAVTQGYFKSDEYKVIDKDVEIKKYVFPEQGDLLFSRANTREMVGATCIIHKDYPDLLLPDKLWKVLFVDRVNVFYMKYILSESSIRAKFSANSTGTSGSMYNVSMDKFKNIEIPVPPKELQERFADFVKQVDKLKFKMENSLEELENNFNSLMQKAFNAEL